LAVVRHERVRGITETRDWTMQHISCDLRL
jgi:hypothetical protein